MIFGMSVSSIVVVTLCYIAAIGLVFGLAKFLEHYVEKSEDE